MIDPIDAICGDEILEPMTEAQEAEFIRRAQIGDERAMERLVKQYGPGLKKVIKWSNFMDHDDAQQTALSAFVEMVQTHDTSKHTRLAGRLGTVISAALKQEARQESTPWTIPSATFKRYLRIKREAQGDLTLAEDLCRLYKMKWETFQHLTQMVEQGTTFEVTQTYSAKQDRKEECVLDSILCSAAMSELDEEERKVIELSYGFTDAKVNENYVSAEGSNRLAPNIVSSALDMTTHRVQKLHESALFKMRGSLLATEVAA